MKLKIFAAMALFSGIAYGDQKIDIPVETIDVVVDQPRTARWEEYRSVPHEKAVELIADAKTAGAACYELPVQKIVVCYFAEYKPKKVGIDFQKVSETLGVQGEASPVVLSKNGHEVMYIQRTYPGSEGMTAQQIEWSKKFGTYEDLQKSVAVDQTSVWVGTVVTLADGKCTESTTSIAEVPKVPGDPKMNVVSKLIPCPPNQAN